MRYEMVPLGERLRYMQLYRVLTVALLAVGRMVSPEVARMPLGSAIAVMGGYLLIAAVSELLWKVSGKRHLPLFGMMLLVDGVFLAYMAYATGGNLSPVRYLVLAHLIVVTLLASYRTGLKLALWHSMLLFVVFHAQEAGFLDPVDAAYRSLPGTDYQRLSTYVAAFWLVALSTAAFSSVNERELRRRRVDLEALANVASALEKVHKPDAVAGVLADALADAFDFERLVVLGEPKGEPTLLAHRGAVSDVTVKPGIDALVKQAWDCRETLRVTRIDPRANPRLAKWLPEAKNLLVTPLLAEDRPIGVVVAEHSIRRGSRVEQRVVAMVSQFSAHAALALDNAWLLERVQEMAETDGLTGVANRRTFEVSLELEITRAFRNSDKLSLVMADIDHFKKLNDTYGHQTGDEVLRAVAGALREESRDFDTVARYGGEEFAVILPSCSAADALELAERLRRRVMSAKSVVAVSVSAGVATYPTHAAGATALVQAADAALYESKRSGRNRVTQSSLDGSGGRPADSTAPALPMAGTTTS